ncbi:hypothetical protein Pfl01_4542 [Pseudomonas fluorescens Pf0-1]|uniref:Uncharacterized protein n=2 Tax=Pseudomonas TaxID=286 RepID=Q3K7H5_PSEPF|nr:hypothetical protein Pfl01_4542 [Pseudomonas fluorescens Pf0-1]
MTHWFYKESDMRNGKLWMLVLFLLQVISGHAYAMTEDEMEEAYWADPGKFDAAAAAWDEARKPKPPNACETAWNNNTANHSCLTHTIAVEPNGKCTFDSITCKDGGTNPTSNWTGNTISEALSVVHVNSSTTYLDLTTTPEIVGHLNNCHGALTTSQCK